MTPAASPVEHRISIDGLEQHAFEWNAEVRGQGPTLVFAHATGFHARCWDQIIHRLGARHAIAVDMRGHGRSESVEIEHWADFGSDLATLIERFELASVFGIGHSMGGHAMVDAAAKLGDRCRGLYLFDPVIGDPEGYAGHVAGHFSKFWGEGHPTARRRNAFETKQQMVERFTDRLPYARFDRAVFLDYCEHGLLPSEAGGFVLACPPSVEASVYMTSRSNGAVFDHAKRVSGPVQIVRARLADADSEAVDFSVSPTWPKLVDLFPNARDLHLAEATHFLPLEDPARIAKQIEACL